MMLRNRGGSTGLPTSGYGGDAYGSSGGTSSAGGYQQSYGGYSGNNGYGGYSNGTGGGGGYAAAGMAAAAAPMSGYSGDNDKIKRRSSRAGGGMGIGGANSSLVMGGMIVAGVFFFLTTLYYRSVANGVLSSLDVRSKADAMDLVDTLKRDVDKYRNQSKDQKRAAHDRYSNQITNLQEEKRRLQKERDEFKAKHADGHGERSELEEEVERLQHREDAFLEQLLRLQTATRRESKRSVLERFGPAPHKVEVKFVLPKDESQHEYNFIIEMAPLDLVPHAVHVFMEQVAHGLWDHTYMYLNGPHILQIGPQNMELYHYEPTTDDDGRGPQLHAFTEKGLKELSFPDYHPDFPHKPWTIGFTGRPGGPDIYINKLDNTEDHGPGGQYQHAIDEQGDPCFAKIVSGQENLATAYQQKTYADSSAWHYFLKDPIEIVQARVLNSVQPIPESMLTDQKPHNIDHKQHNGEEIKPQLPKGDHMTAQA
eukprot:CAMPEP_0119555360 /NCGR_PEP_ID=MMETSP1352-20130426/7608_1 /TAXON_ID=265584 /ORGANISM="Stauroneis constricta, Strain CCMP1120" /LENGTH=480 /DNA_ID=CAMNT_0007602113 /DNA_START=31 /DNA_END=1473 /DNA_ORIENTATION=-